MKLIAPVCTVVTLAVFAAVAAKAAQQFSIQPRPADPLLSSPVVARAPARQPFSLRLVDAGGVGIPLDAWGRDYSHDRRTFRDVIREDVSVRGRVGLRRVECEWRFYVDRMIEYGNNAIAVPLLLELSTSIVRPSTRGLATRADLRSGESIPGASCRRPTPLRAAVRMGRRARHARLPRHRHAHADAAALFGPSCACACPANALGIDTIQSRSCGRSIAQASTSCSTAAGRRGVVIRFGEGGNLYNTEGWPYRSEMAVRDAASLRAMLRESAAAVRSSGTRRSCFGAGPSASANSVGFTSIPANLRIRARRHRFAALVVSTKFTAGDFFSYLPLNPTLAAGRHRRIVELQAKPEFEGFGAFPNFLGDEHARALRALRSANPQHRRYLCALAGRWTASRRASRCSIRCTASGCGPTPTSSSRRSLAESRCRRHGADEAMGGRHVRRRPAPRRRRCHCPGRHPRGRAQRFLYSAVRRARRARSGARAAAADVDLRVGHGGWLAQPAQRRVSAPAATRSSRRSTKAMRPLPPCDRARQRLESAFAAACPEAQAELCKQTLRSLEYAETLFDVLAAWRQAFLSYYRWLDTGDSNAWSAWQAGQARFTSAANEHRRRFDHDLDFPAFDLTSAEKAVTEAQKAGWVRYLASALLIGTIALLVLGSPFGKRHIPLATRGWIAGVAGVTWTSAVTPWRLGRQRADLSAAVTVTVAALALFTLLIGMLTAFAAMSIVASIPVLIAIVAVVFEAAASGGARRDGRGRNLVACSGPAIPGIALLFLTIMYFGPIGFWFAFWTEPYLPRRRCDDRDGYAVLDRARHARICFEGRAPAQHRRRTGGGRCRSRRADNSPS